MKEKNITCFLCGGKFVGYAGLSSHLTVYHRRISEREYYVRFLIKENDNNGICYNNICHNRTTFKAISKGFRKYCSIKCALSDENLIERRKQTCLKIYGGIAPAQNKKVRSKQIKTCIKKYGKDNVFKNKEIQEKKKETCKNKFGDEISLRNELVKDRYRDTCLERYGKKYYVQSSEFKEKLEETNMKRYGVMYPFESKEIQKKLDETFKKKYGVNRPLQSKEIRDKINKILKEKRANRYEMVIGGDTIEILFL